MFYLITSVKITVPNHRNIIWDTFKNVDKASRIYCSLFFNYVLGRFFLSKPATTKFQVTWGIFGPNTVDVFQTIVVYFPFSVFLFLVKYQQQKSHTHTHTHKYQEKVPSTHTHTSCLWALLDNTLWSVKMETVAAYIFMSCSVCTDFFIKSCCQPLIYPLLFKEIQPQSPFIFFHTMTANGDWYCNSV